MDEFASLLAQTPDPTLRGILPTRGSFMLDFVFLAMFGIMAALGVSIYLVRYRKLYQLHKQMQLVMALVLLVAVTAFEVDLNLITKNWRPLAMPSPYYASGIVNYALWIHLCFAVPTPILWIVVIVRAWRQFPNPAAPASHSRSHLLWGRIAALGMLMTSVTGWIFYWLAFVA